MIEQNDLEDLANTLLSIPELSSELANQVQTLTI